MREEEIQPVEHLVLQDDPVRMPLGRALRYVLRVQTNVVLIVATASGYFFFAGLRTFGIVFARGHFGLSQSMASTLFTLIGLGALVGVLTGGRLADAWMRRGRANARVMVAIVGYLAAALVLPAGLLTTSLIIAVPLYLIGTAAFSLPNPPLDAARLDVMPSRLWGRAEGLRTVVLTTAEAGAPLLFGVMAGALGGSGEQHHAQGLMYAFLIAVVPLALNGVVLVRALGTYPRDVATAARLERADRPAVASYPGPPTVPPPLRRVGRGSLTQGPVDLEDQRQAARDAVFERAQALADALMDPHAPERWEPLRDLVLAGLEAGGLRHAMNTEALRAAAGELAAATLDARRQRPA